MAEQTFVFRQKHLLLNQVSYEAGEATEIKQPPFIACQHTWTALPYELQRCRIRYSRSGYCLGE